MTAPREALLQKVRQWAYYADEDLRLAHHAFSIPHPPYRLIAYHAQQCAEKYLKAYLVFREMDFPFTHNISTLLELCEPLADWVSDLAEAEKLTAYAVSARYPGVDDEVVDADAQEAVRLAAEIRDRVRGSLHGAGLESP